jgi:hypothetical protein
MDDPELAVYRACTNRQTAPTTPVREAWLICGRRAGKSLNLATLATCAAVRDYRDYLAPGERCVIPVIASTARQGKIIFSYIKAMLQTPLLKQKVVREIADGLELSNGN